METIFTRSEWLLPSKKTGLWRVHARTPLNCLFSYTVQIMPEQSGEAFKCIGLKSPDTFAYLRPKLALSL
jgi:hypothetical protein